MARLMFYDDEHVYQLDGEPLPSVSELTRFISKEVYTDVNQFNLDRAAERGTAVHKATEALDKYGSVDVDEEYIPYLKGYIAFLKDNKPKWSKIEYASFNEKLRYAGTIDRLSEDGYIYDIKTSYTVHKPMVIAQLSLYRMMLESQGIKVKGQRILHLKKDGTYKVIDVDYREDVAMACITLHNLLKKKTRSKKSNDTTK